MKPKLIGLIFLLLICGCTANVSVISHDESKAMDTANHYILAVIKGDYDSCYKNQLSDNTKNELSLEEFKENLTLMTSDRGETERASFEYFQPVPGQRAIQLYYRIEHKKTGPTLYQFTMEGDSNQGYRIAWIGEIEQQVNSSVPQMGKDIFAEITPKCINADGKR